MEKIITTLLFLAALLSDSFANGELNTVQDCQGYFTLSSQAEVDAFTCTEVNGSLIISGGDITNLNSLSSLRMVSGGLSIVDNPNLETIDLPAFHTYSGNIRIARNGKLNSISGFNNILQAGSIYIQDNPKLEIILGFNSLAQTQILSEFVIQRNDVLTSIQGFAGLETIWNLRITNNPALLALDGFPSLKYVTGDFQISDNESLKTINGFNELTDISGLSRLVFDAGLFIENNASLESLAGLSSLRSMSAPLDGGRIPPVHGNVRISITRNPKLTPCCELQPLLDWLHSGGTLPPHVFINISENGSACNFLEILECGQQRVLNFTLLNHQTKSIIQNFQDEIAIDLADPKFSHLMLQANASPQQVGSVEFIFDGHIRHTENGFPYQFILPQLTPGTHTARVDVYSKSQKQGVRGIGRTATFNIPNPVKLLGFDVVNPSGQLLMPLNEGAEINIKNPAFRNFRIRANPASPIVSRVDFFIDNSFVAVEHGFPFELIGNALPGNYTVAARPSIIVGKSQFTGPLFEINFTVVSENLLANALARGNMSNEESLRQSESSGVTIFPVPVDNELHIKVDDTAGKDPTLTIRTIHGLIVYQDSYSKSQSVNTLNLQPGVYYLQVLGNSGFHQVIKFIKN